MANKSGYIDTKAFLHDQVGGANLRSAGQDPDVPVAPLPSSGYALADLYPARRTGPRVAGSPSGHTPTSKPGVIEKSMGEYWFERLHIIPKSIAFGNILGTVVRTMELYNAYTATPQSLTAFTNNAGSGLAITNLPALPSTLQPQKGLSLTVQATTSGVPSFNTTLDFAFGATILRLPVSGNRVIILTARPEVPITETIQFITDVLEHTDGSEQRLAARANPRHIYEFSLFREYGPEYARLEHLLYEWQHRVFGMPIWHEPSYLTAAAQVGNLTVTVNSTDNASFRVGGLALLYTDETTYTALQITAISGTTLTFDSPVDQTFPSGTEVMPIRTGLAEQLINGNRQRVGAGLMQLKITSLDNLVVGSTAGWSVYGGKVLLDDPNLGDGLAETLTRRLVIFDNATGKQSQTSPWARFRRGSSKGWFIRDRATLWKVRLLLYSLRGRQVSFYLPTFNKQLTPTQSLNNGSPNLVVTNTGYSRFVQSRAGRNVIRLRFTDGTSVVRTITSAGELSTSEEQLVLDATWGRTYQVAEVDAIDYFEKVRLDSDSASFRHTSTLGDATMTVPVKGVLE